MALVVACLVVLVGAVVALALTRDLLYGGLALAASSVALAVVLFSLGAPVAAAFELSVCAGLITVLFVSTVSLTKDSDRAAESRAHALLLLPVLAALGALAYFTVGALAPQLVTPAAPAATATFHQVFWGARATDLLGQIALVLVAVLGMRAILRERREETHHE